MSPPEPSRSVAVCPDCGADLTGAHDCRGRWRRWGLDAAIVCLGALLGALASSRLFGAPQAIGTMTVLGGLLALTGRRGIPGRRRK